MKLSPRITKFSWGRIEIENSKIFKDVKLFPGGSREWNWQETGTQHSPGIQYSDVRELIDNDAEVVILSRGVFGRLKIQEELIKHLDSIGITTYVLKTKDAVKLYTSLYESKKVGALIHSTC